MKSVNALSPYSIFFGILLLFSCSTGGDDSGPSSNPPPPPPPPQQEAWEVEVEQLTTAMQQYLDFNTALANGYDTDASGYVPQMGHHYVNMNLVDSAFDLLNPEILLYVPNGGSMDFVAVEYFVPVADINNPGLAPIGFTGNRDVWALNTQLGGWTLHVWIIRDNPSGIFAPLNPTLD